MYQIRLWVKLVLIGLIVGFLTWSFLWYRGKLIQEGEDKVKAKDAALVAAKIVHNQEVEDRAKSLSEKQIEELKKQLGGPPAPDAPHLVCLSSVSNKRSSSSSSEASSSRSSASSTPEQPAVVPESVETKDYGAEIDKRFADDDAVIKALQERVELDFKTCGS